MSPATSTGPATAASASASGGANYIEHPVSNMDTLAGVAIKYGVEVADIKRMNGLATDLQMFALKSLQIPLPGRHLPSPSLSDGSVSLGGCSTGKLPPRTSRSNVVDLFQSSRSKSPKGKVSPAMSTLQNYYGLETPKKNGVPEGTEMAVYRLETSHFSDDGLLPKPSPISYPLLPRPHNYGNKTNGILLENGAVAENLPIAEAGDGEGERSNEKSIRRRQKAEADSLAGTPERLLKVENGGVRSGFSAITGKGLALRPKLASRAASVADIEAGSLILADMGASTMANGHDGVRKSSSTSSLQEQDPNSSSSVWPTSKWNLKPDLQALSSAAIIFDGLPKPGRWNKAARD
ncbi:uncharacterized protein LOC131158242 [Malania oleifera]|uniref:uncharacterized protein LOC131158242 n=1 Tax=Malania oleifera TaxID=397392 RepID=UPI0025AE01FF|nr:uncharacterized protein LOC131158242 [Malania oleifera]